MAMAFNARKVDSIGKSVESFNTEAQISPVWGISCGFHAAKKNL